MFYLPWAFVISSLTCYQHSICISVFTFSWTIIELMMPFPHHVLNSFNWPCIVCTLDLSWLLSLGLLLPARRALGTCICFICYLMQLQWGHWASSHCDLRFLFFLNLQAYQRLQIQQQMLQAQRNVSGPIRQQEQQVGATCWPSSKCKASKESSMLQEKAYLWRKSTVLHALMQT